MQDMHRLLCAGVCLTMGGCFWSPPEIPPEIAAVLAEPAFSEAADVTHQGNLEDLEGCWGSLRVIGRSTDVVFHKFADPDIRAVIYATWPWPGVIVEEGVYGKLDDGKSILLTITNSQTSEPETGALEPLPSVPAGGYLPRNYEVPLDGERMKIWNPGVDAEQYDGTFWRFEVCP